FQAIYDRLFTWVVQKINESITVEQTSRYNKGTVIGVLDIYGFEIFGTNSFEQLCINYCNEKLQQLFIELVLKQEQEEYEREGIQWSKIDYFNNKIICDLVELPRTGILSVLDDACASVGNVTDQVGLLSRTKSSIREKSPKEKILFPISFASTTRILVTFPLSELDKNLQSHKHYTSRGLKQSEKSIKHDEFRVTHYAGDVTYSVNGFMDKNRDTLFQDLKRLLFN
ncbi:unnamed protein product, partial [Haemonchus placei]|uniref:Myosin motor domain-containing protein n=1 Tax=Haemonchus placei TaxID=6290 RepID=A0A0N4VZM9_HAEPC